MYIACVIKSEVNSFIVDSQRGLSSAVEEELLCCHYTLNYHNLFAVAKCKDTTIVGHVPRSIPAIYCFSRKA